MWISFATHVSCKCLLTKFFAGVVGHDDFADTAAGLVVAFRIDAIEERDPLLLALADESRRNICFDNPPVTLLPADLLELTVDELFAAFVLANALVNGLLTRDADIIHVGFVAPDRVHGKDDLGLTIRCVFATIHV